MNEEQRKVIRDTLSLVRAYAGEVDAKLAAHGGTALDDLELANAISNLREATYALDVSFQDHLGAKELLRRARAGRAKTIVPRNTP